MVTKSVWSRVVLIALSTVVFACGRTLDDSAQARGGSGNGADAGGPPAGDAGSGNASAGSVGADAGGVGGVSTNECGASIAPARLTLLSDAQWRNSVRDLLGVEFDGEVAHGASTTYRLDEQEAVTRDLLRRYLGAADRVAMQAHPCVETRLTASCVEAFLREKLPRAWRRPVSDTEIAPLLSLFRDAQPYGDDYAARTMIRAMLLSSEFLYRTELGAETGGGPHATPLTPHELAAAVSFAFLDSVPDAELWARAEDGSLVRHDVLSAQADRLLVDPRVRENLRRKVSHYLNLEGLSDPILLERYPSVYESGQRFLDDVLWRGRFSDLFTSHRVYANDTVSSTYGLPSVADGAFVALDVEDGSRDGGILTQPAFLLANAGASPGREVASRGHFIYRAFACGEPLPARPPDEESVFSALTGPGRERFRQLESTACGDCHATFDAYGFPLESYDAIGRRQVADATTGAPIDTSATIRGAGPDLDGPVRNVSELAARLAAGRRTSDCAVRPLVTMIVDHAPSAANACVQQWQDELASSGAFAGLFKAIVTSPAFLTRDLEDN